MVNSEKIAISFVGLFLALIAYTGWLWADMLFKFLVNLIAR